MSEKELFLQMWAREFRTTVKIMKAYPADKLDLQPSDKSRTARQLLWAFVSEEVVVDGICKGAIDFGGMTGPPDTLDQIIAEFETRHARNAENVKAMSDRDYDSGMEFFVAPKKVGQVRRADILWTFLLDSVHHRGQLSVYLRIAGAKVPSIYGPTADEPWT